MGLETFFYDMLGVPTEHGKSASRILNTTKPVELAHSQDVYSVFENIRWSVRYAQTLRATAQHNLVGNKGINDEPAIAALKASLEHLKFWVTFYPMTAGLQTAVVRESLGTETAGHFSSLCAEIKSRALQIEISASGDIEKTAKQVRGCAEMIKSRFWTSVDRYEQHR